MAATQSEIEPKGPYWPVFKRVMEGRLLRRPTTPPPDDDDDEEEEQQVDDAQKQQQGQLPYKEGVITTACHVTYQGRQENNFRVIWKDGTKGVLPRREVNQCLTDCFIEDLAAPLVCMLQRSNWHAPSEEVFKQVMGDGGLHEDDASGLGPPPAQKKNNKQQQQKKGGSAGAGGTGGVQQKKGQGKAETTGRKTQQNAAAAAAAGTTKVAKKQQPGKAATATAAAAGAHNAQQPAAPVPKQMKRKRSEEEEEEEQEANNMMDIGEAQQADTARATTTPRSPAPAAVKAAVKAAAAAKKAAAAPSSKGGKQGSSAAAAAAAAGGSKPGTSAGPSTSKKQQAQQQQAPQAQQVQLGAEGQVVLDTFETNAQAAHPEGVESYVSVMTGRKIPGGLCCLKDDTRVGQVSKDDYGDEYEVDYIVDELVTQHPTSKKRTTWYLVKWSGYELNVGDKSGCPKGDWEPESSVEQTAQYLVWQQHKPAYYTSTPREPLIHPGLGRPYPPSANDAAAKSNNKKSRKSTGK